ncbi:TetR/AcrR family transcriptional regulator [Streptomyces sp. ME19-01-6]|uniref:TetR/AcrR family transcriptional regulator n=1 Tax=Streptomyces sp. ME19-01-6 TaxID=3028686 RepID=UPI0029BAF32C|nr:TetR/AcrR family transcriptional regulator [Streptomyces sp. ME19-01-6]MDX3227362.1 TetR/AcrR family transcriptional regulator [Streptomyces sp. ME19-01-6]
MAETGTTTPRERYRAQVRAEIKKRAWEQIATAGASALSLNAIAKQMGMSGPALYRYFASRDELITELIRDAYRSLADTFRAASETSGADVAALAHALRGWALADPQRYFLIYGTPVPGYHAPDDITAIASENMAVLLDAWTARPPDAPATPFAEHLEGLGRQWTDGHPAPPAALHQALTFWTRLHGVLSLELAGHFTGMGFDPAQLFAAELDALLDSSGGAESDDTARHGDR